MEADVTSVDRETCLVHPERQAVERCETCGRAACLTCAVPVRGRVLCAECASREVGVPSSPVPAPSTQFSTFPHVVAASLFSVGLVATIVPWDRFGVLTSVLSAWRPDPEPWPLVASVSLLLGALGAVSRLAPRTRWLIRRSAVGYTAAGVIAGAATAEAVFGAPSYVTHSFAPYVVLGVSVAICGLGLLWVRRGVP